jgi:hypothetical protein
MAYFNPTHELRNEATYEDGAWKEELQEYTNERITTITKSGLLNFFLKNYKNNENIQEIRTIITDYTRSDTIERVAEHILNTTLSNVIIFTKKTSITGRGIRNIAEFINAEDNTSVTELTNVSLLLQDNASDPVRAYQITKENNIKQYLIIGNKHMTQKVQYLCLGLVPNWFPELLEGLDETRLNAFKTLCYSIGKMQADLYCTSVRNCIELCAEPPAPTIDYTPITRLLSNDVQTKITQLQRTQASTQERINSILRDYENYINVLQQTTWELSKLITEDQTEQTEDTINIAKKFKSVVNYEFKDNEHYITIRSKMLIESDAIVKKILAPNNTTAQAHYGILTEKARRLFEDLWINKTLTLDFCTLFNKVHGNAVPYCNVPTLPRLTTHTMPNPHLLHYSCYGDNRRQIIDACTSNNLEYYLGSLTAANSNLNTGDATVLNSFCRDLLTRYIDRPLLYDIENKKYISPRERMKLYETVQTDG